jgi:hypothetical protein
MAGRATTFQFDDRTLDNIDRLRGVDGVTSTAAVIRRALAVASVVAEEATPNGRITIRGKGEPLTLLINQ